MSKDLTVKIKKGKLFYHIVLLGANGEPIMSSETYYSKSNAHRAAALVNIKLGNR